MKFRRCRVAVAMMLLAVSAFAAGDGVTTSQSACRHCSRHNVEVLDIDSPDADYSIGVSAAYAAAMGGKLLVAGGCNFPDKSVADGGAKRFYSEIYSADLSCRTATFHLVGKLPMPLAYGVAIEWNGSMIVVGGCNSQGSHANVWQLTIVDGKTKVAEMPSLPCTMDNMAGALLDDKIYVVGGNQDGKASSAVYSLDLKKMENGWTSVGCVPGAVARVQPVCVAQDGRLYVWGGFAPATASGEAQVSCGGYCYTPCDGSWRPCAGAVGKDGMKMTFTGGVGCAATHGKILCLGGVNADIFTNALNGRYDTREYLSHDKDWYKFNGDLGVYDCATDSWDVVQTDSRFARAGTTLVKDGDAKLYLIQGELKPGIRTNSIVKIKLK